MKSKLILNIDNSLVLFFLGSWIEYENLAFIAM